LNTSQPYPNWHCVTIEETPSGWMVVCVPHGMVRDSTPTHLAAFEAALQHDFDTGAFNYGKGHE